MKRRDFLVSSLGVTGAMLPGAAFGQTKPCPPSPLSAAGGTTATTICGPGSAPSWFVGMSDRTWAAVAGGAGQTLDAVKPDPLPPAATGHRSVCIAWTGGCVDQDNGRLILAANGGHLDYSGNEVYACNIRQETPAWQRLSDPTPASHVDDDGSLGGLSSIGGNSIARYADGNPRSVHGWNRCVWANGRVWYTGMDGMYDGFGDWSTAIWSFDLTTLKWNYHGKVCPTLPTTNGSNFSWQGGPAVFDRVNNRIWTMPQYGVEKTATGNYCGVNAVNATTAAVVNYDLQINNMGGMWAVVAHDRSPPLLIMGRNFGGALYWMDLSNPAGGLKQATASGSGAHVKGYGAVYHAPSSAVLCWNSNGSNLLKLSIPSSPATGTWAWSTVSSFGGVTPTAGPSQGTFSRFNIVEDMGNGQAAIVLINSTTQPVYVYKLPASGL